MPDNDFMATATDEALDAALHEKPVAAGNESSSAERKIAELEAQAREANERALRTQAELENFRKRSQRELVDERRYAIVPLVRDLLAVADNLERAIAAAGDIEPGTLNSNATHSPALLEGVKMVASQLEAVLKQHQCVRMETVGAMFDPNQHQAIAQEPSDQYPAGTVTRAVQVGYKLHDRVIRPAQVFVSTGPAKAAGENVPA